MSSKNSDLGDPPRISRTLLFVATEPEPAGKRSGTTGVQAVLALPVVADQRRLGKQRQLFGVVEREPQTVCSVPDAQVLPQGLVDVLGMDPPSRRVVPLQGAWIDLLRKVPLVRLSDHAVRPSLVLLHDDEATDRPVILP